MAYIEFRGICKSYDGVNQVLKNIDLDVEKVNWLLCWDQVVVENQRFYVHQLDLNKLVQERSSQMVKILPTYQYKTWYWNGVPTVFFISEYECRREYCLWS